MGFPQHLFASESGELYDTRRPQWSRQPALRATYRRHYATIDNPQQFKATIRAGAYAWPGGYQLAFLCDDGATLCFDCARKEVRQIIPAIAGRDKSGWRVVACYNVDDCESYTACDNCNVVLLNPEPETDDDTPPDNPSIRTCHPPKQKES